MKKKDRKCENCQDYGGCFMLKGKEPTEVCENWKLDFMIYQKAIEGIEDPNLLEDIAKKLW